MLSRHPDMIAAWFLVMVLLVAVGTAPWEKMRVVHPSGIVDVAQQRFEIKVPGGLRSGHGDADHRFDARFITFHPEGL